MSLSPATRAAFTEFYTPLHERFARYCASRCLGTDAVEDVMQEAILSALERWEALEDKRRLLGYMIGIVDRQVRNRLRSRTVHRRFAEQRQRELERRLPEDPDAALELDLILRAIDRLPGTQREALLLHTVSGFSIREVSEAQNSSAGAVRVRIHRARRGLRALLDERNATAIPFTQRLLTLSLLL